MINRNFTFTAALLVPACLCATAHADISFGGNARILGMGGAGVAVVDRSGRSSLINPAALALQDRRSRFEFPTVGVHADGIPLSQAWRHLISRPNSNDVVGLARDFGKQESDFSAALGIGYRMGHVDATAMGIGQVRILPNAALMNWSKTANGDITKLTGAEKADLYGAGIYSLPVVSGAERISAKGSPTRVEAGVRVKLSRAVYSHYLVSSANIMNNTAASSAPELNGRSTITKDGIGADFGLLAHPTAHNGFSAAMVVTNLLDPNFRIRGTNASGAPATFALQPRSVTLGSAYESGRYLVAADAVDLTRSYGNVQGRLGVELTTKGISYRLGYSSARGYTGGIGYRWAQIAIGSRVPLEITRTLNF